MTDEQREIVARSLERQGYRELAAAYMWAAGVPLAPTPDDKLLLSAHLNEELHHFELAANLYEAVRGAELAPVVERRARALPMPESWMEVAMVQCVFDRAGTFQLREFQRSRFQPHAKMITQILAEEDGHSAAGDAALRDLAEQPEWEPDAAQSCFHKWLRLALLSFGRAGTNRAIELGLKLRDSTSVMNEYVCDLVPTAQACGLRFPTTGALGLEISLELPSP